MSKFLEPFLILAQEAEPVKKAVEKVVEQAGEPLKEAANNKGPQSNLMDFAIPFMAMIFLWYFILIRPQKKEKSKRDDFLSALKKNDQVVTIGGIIGTVVNMSEEEVTIRVDDSTRIKMLRSSIQVIRNDSSKEESK